MQIKIKEVDSSKLQAELEALAVRPEARVIVTPAKLTPAKVESYLVIVDQG